MDKASPSPLRVLEPKDVAKMLHISERTVRHLAQNNQLPGRRVGTRWRFCEEELRRFMESSGAAGSPEAA